MPTIKRLISTGVDCYIFPSKGGDLNSVELASECGGAPDYNLSVIPDGTIVTLRRGNTVKRRVKVYQGVASECVFNMLGMSPALARLFKIKDRERYTLTYNTESRTLTIHRKPVTFYTITIKSNVDIPINRVVIGNGLGISTALGITLGNGGLIHIKRGDTTAQVRLRKVSNGFDYTDVFRLHPDNVHRLNLVAGVTYRVSYNQITNTLRFYNRAATIIRRRKS